MALFGKKKTPSTQIPELQEYYASQKTESTGLAWLLALGSLLATVAVFIGVFLGGRWVYRQITKDDKAPASTSSQKADDTTVNEDGTTAVTSLTPTPTTPPAPSQPTATVTAPTTTGNIGSSVVASPAQGVSPSQTSEANKNAVAASTTIPDTGLSLPIVSFVAVMLIAAYAHRTYTISKNS